MGRRHLSAVAALAAVSLTLAGGASAAAGIRWRVLGSGAAPAAAVSTPTGYVAVDRAATAAFAPNLPSAAARIVHGVDFSRAAVVAIFGEFGCRDHRIAVAAVVRQGATLVVRLVERPLAPGTVECMAIFPTYRILSVAKSVLDRPYPTHATVTLAPA